MRILYFTSLKGFHGVKWLKAIKKTQDVYVATFSVEECDKIPGITFLEVQPNKTKSLEKQSSLDAKKTESADKRPTPGTQKTTAQEAWLTYKIGLRFARKYAALIDKIKPDLVHAHQSLPFGWYAWQAVKKSKTKPPLIVSVWGSDILEFARDSLLNRHMNKKVLRGATRVTATGKYLQKKAAKFMTDQNKKPLVIPFGIDLDKFLPKLEAPKNIRTFGIAKQLKPIYRIDLALRALAIASQQQPTYRLELAGSGPEEQRLKELAKKLGIVDKVAFLGAVPADKMPGYMRAWDVLLNSTSQEGFGVVALEAAACGTPMIATNTGGLPEVTSEGKTARLIHNLTPARLAQAMLEIDRDKTLINRCLSTGPVFVKNKYDWQKNVEQMLNLYNEVTR